MSAFTPANRTRLNVFPSGDAYLFREYFDEDALFATLAPYYDDERYRFSVPRGRFEMVAERLKAHGYAPVVVDDPEPFVVAHRRFAEHPSILFESAVDRTRTDQFTLFLLKDQESVQEAIEAGAVAIEELDGIDWPVD